MTTFEITEMTEIKTFSPEEVFRYICTRNTQEIAHLMRGFGEPAAQAMFAATLLLAPRIVAGPSATPEKIKKAMNAFVGFRCYYLAIPVFKLWPMKKLSHPLGQLWEYEPDKPLWTLMTKAWSAIRDQVGKDNAPLDQFFQIVCTHLNILTPEMYLAGRGWIVEFNEEGMPTLSRDSATTSTASVSASFSDLTLSVEDIINVCQTAGYATNYVPDQNAASPTFLGRSVQDMRHAARNKRRAKRQTTKNSGAAAALQQDIMISHDALAASVPQELERPEQTQFYQGLSELLSSYNINVSIDTAGHHDNGTATPVMNNANASVPTFMGAFRLGADADATLPPFDPFSLELR